MIDPPNIKIQWQIFDDASQSWADIDFKDMMRRVMAFSRDQAPEPQLRITKRDGLPDAIADAKKTRWSRGRYSRGYGTTLGWLLEHDRGYLQWITTLEMPATPHIPKAARLLLANCPSAAADRSEAA